MEHFELAIYYNDSYECIRFKDIYERMANIIYINKDPRRKIDKVEILSRIYNIFKDKIQAVLRTTNKFLITELIKE